MSDDAKRTFAVEGSTIGFRGGRYKGASPFQAAKKAAKALFRRLDNDAHYRQHKSAKSMKIMLRETTRGSTHEEFFYEAIRTEKKDPVKRVVNGVELEYKFDYKLNSCDKFNHSA